MVIKGRFSKKPPKPVQPNLKSPTTQIDKIASLSKKPQHDRALEILHEIAQKTAPIMRQYNFKVKLLCEFFPSNPNLLGLNVNGGAKICIRLRPANNENWFLPMESVIETMLHELTHNRHGPHDGKFYKLLDELKDKYNDIQIRGSLASTGYVSMSNILGTQSRYDSSSMREKRIKKLSEVKYVSTVQRLGTSLDQAEIKTNKKKSMRDLMLEAIERRIKDNKWCPGESDELKKQSQSNEDDLDIITIEDFEDKVHDRDEEDIKKGKETKIEVQGSKREIHEVLSESEDEGSNATKRSKIEDNDDEDRHRHTNTDHDNNGVIIID